MNTKAIKLLNESGGLRLSESCNWHVLKLESDGKDKGDCQLCHQSIFGPTYKCMDMNCGFFLHKSCIEQPHSQDVKHKHRLWEINHMIFIEKLEIEEKIVCSFCEEPVSSFTYKCPILGCNFLLHQSCADLPFHISYHPAHLHGLGLRGPLKNQLCDLCCEVRRRCFSYKCDLCTFTIHIKCAVLCLISVENCYPHKFVTMRKDVGQFTCQACGMQNDEIVFLCRNCRLLIHWRCAKTYQRNIKTKECDHTLTFIYSLPPIEHKCRVCKGLVDKRYAAYICDICDYVIHIWCAYAILDSMEDKAVRLQEIENHFSHPEHKLILSNEQPKYDQHCMVCMDQIISPSFYGCALCKVFLHERCGKLPPKIKPSFDGQKKLTLLPKTSSTCQWCYGCRRTCSSFIYRIGKSSNVLDIQCALLQNDLKHGSHEHRLFFDWYTGENCIGCNELKNGYFRCTLCNFNLCCKCATYPPQARHRYHKHLLNLTYKAEDDSGEYYCLVCEQERDPNHWFYYCLECDFSVHLKCAYFRVDPLIKSQEIVLN